MSDLTLSPLVQLPDEILEKILLFLPTRDLQAVSRTCRKINHVAKADRIWEPRTVAAFGEDKAYEMYRFFRIPTWRQVYQKLAEVQFKIARDHFMRLEEEEEKRQRNMFRLRPIETTSIAPAFLSDTRAAGSMGGRTVIKLICPSQYLRMLPGFLEKAVIGVISANQYIAQQKISPSQIEKHRTFHQEPYGFRDSEEIKEIFATVKGVVCFLKTQPKTHLKSYSEIRYTHCRSFEPKGAISVRALFCSRVWIQQNNATQITSEIPNSNFSMYPRVELNTSPSEATLYD